MESTIYAVFCCLFEPGMLFLHVFYHTFDLSDTSWTPLGDPSAGRGPETRRMTIFHLFLFVFTRGGSQKPGLARGNGKREGTEPVAKSAKTWNLLRTSPPPAQAHCYTSVPWKIT